MYCYRKVTEDLYWVGSNDRRLAMFEGVYSVPDGVSYNSYLLMDEKTMLLDTVDKAVKGVFFENIEEVLGGIFCSFLNAMGVAVFTAMLNIICHIFNELAKTIVFTNNQLKIYLLRIFN